MRAQAATEYLLVSSTILIIVIPAIFFFLRFSQMQVQSFDSSQVLRLGDQLALVTQNAYDGGENTRTTLSEQFPDGIDNITFVWNSTLVQGEYIIRYDPSHSGSPYVYGFPVNVPVHLDSAHTQWGKGQRTLRLDVLDNATAPPDRRLYVNLTVI